MSGAQADRALLQAAAADDVSAARRALAAGANLETRNGRQQTPLIIATKQHHAEVAATLLDAGADPNAKDELSDSAFLYAGAEGYNDILRLTLRHGADVDSVNRFGGTALIPASEHGHGGTVRILIDAGVPIDHANSLGWTALLEAIVLGDGSARHVDVVRQLIGAGADLGIRDAEGRTPRSLAVTRNQSAIVQLIDDAEQIRERGQRLIAASGRGDAEAVTRLLAADASVSARDDTRRTALVAAAYGNHLAVAKQLLAAGADPNVKDETVQSAYLISTSEVGDDPRLLRLLLDHGADVASLDSWLGTGLIRAADRGYASIVEVLLDTKIDIDHVNRIGYTALHEAVVLGDGGPSHQRTVAALVRGGVDTSIKDSQGRTALQSARERGYDRIAALLD
ncbi:MAG TPA: ankyrin repeat domain-containing protein [Microlunatus sp.]